jgi:hypothetical protein
MSPSKPLALGAKTSLRNLLPGTIYAVPYRQGHMLCLAAVMDSVPVFVLLGRHNTDSLDDPPAWVSPESLSASDCYELPESHIEPAHASGTVANEQPEGPPKSGDLLEDSNGQHYLFLKQKMDRRVFALDSGMSGPVFDAAVVYRRWRLRQGIGDTANTLAMFESH